MIGELKIILEPRYIKRLLNVCCGLCLMSASISAQVLPKEAIKLLGDDQFTKREKGQAQLLKWSLANLQKSPEMLYSAWKKEKDPEAKTRCFSILKKVVTLRKFGRGPGFVGIRMDAAIVAGGPDKEELIGVRITLVLPGTPAEKSALALGDVVVGVDALDFNQPNKRHLINDVLDAFMEYIREKHPDDEITLHIIRNGKKIEKKVTLIARPPDADGPFGRAQNDTWEQKENYFNEWLNKMERKR